MDETREISGLRDHAGYWLRRLSDTVHTTFERALARHGVTVAQWCVLIVVAQGEATTPREVAAIIGIDGGAVSRLVERLVAKGLLLRTADPHDRRSVCLSLTERGRALTARLVEIADRNDEAFFGVLSAAESAQFSALLARLLRGAGLEPVGRPFRSPAPLPGTEEPMANSQPSPVHSITKTVFIRREPREVFAYLADLAHWPDWSIVNVKAIGPRPGDDWWDMATPLGAGRLRLRPNAELGILDHDFVAPDASWTVPARVVPKDDGAVFMMTFFQPPQLAADVFEQQANLVDLELARLKEILEAPAASAG